MRLLKPEDWDRWTGERYLAIMIDMQVEHYTFDSNHSILLLLHIIHQSVYPKINHNAMPMILKAISPTVFLDL